MSLWLPHHAAAALRAGPILEGLEELPLGMQVRSAISMSGTQGKDDLHKTVVAAGIALGIVWAGLVLRYRAAGLLGFFLSVVFLWLHLVLFNASSYALSDAAIVAVVLNIGLAADAHIIAFERVREDLHALPRGAGRPQGLAALHSALRISLITVLEANITTMLAMVVLYGVGTGGTVEFAFTVIISVSVGPCWMASCAGLARSWAGTPISKRLAAGPAQHACMCAVHPALLVPASPAGRQPHAPSHSHTHCCPSHAGVRLHSDQRAAGARPAAPGLECSARLLRRLLRGQGARV